MTGIHTEQTLKAYSIWSFALAISMMAVLGYLYFDNLYFDNVAVGSELTYGICAALFHLIYGIWFLKGKGSVEFARRTVWGRYLYGSFLLLVVLSIWALGLPNAFNAGAFPYVLSGVMLIALIELISASLTHRSLNNTESMRERPASQMTFKSKNRFVFGLYLIALGLVLLLEPNALLRFFYLEETIFSGLGFEALAIGPIHIVGIQLLILGAYNIFAARRNVEALIEAGMRGGKLTVVFFLVLVGFGILHPLTLLLPGLDVVSIVLIGLKKNNSSQAE